MTTTLRFTTALLALLACTSPAAGQQATGTEPAGTATVSAPAAAQDEAPAAESSWKKGRPITMQYFRPLDKRGINVFETTKSPGVEFTGFKLDFGAAFTSQVQNLSHSNTAVPVMASGVDTNQLADIGFGFNNSTANLALNAQVAPGIRVALTSYLSSRHHNETWVKDGYMQIDQSPIDLLPLRMLFEIATVRVGHMEINYGDAHFRRSDNGNGMFNAFAGNYILDDFTTEIGAEVYERSGPFLAMVGITGGEIHGQVANPGGKSVGTLGKIGFDQSLGKDLRFRLTGSFYANNKAISSTLFTGDRGGSMYYDVLENTASTETANAWSGQVRPGFSNKVNAQVINPFIKIGGAEFFGSFETATGGAFSEPKLRTLHQNV